MIAVILAGGCQRRFNAFMPGVPKILAPIWSRPFLDYLMADLRRSGAERYIILAGAEPDAERIAVAARRHPEKIDVISQWPPLGTAGDSPPPTRTPSGRRRPILGNGTGAEFLFATGTQSSAPCSTDPLLIRICCKAVQ